MTDFPILQTPRLQLRAPQMEDAPRITKYIGEKDVAWNLGRAPYPYKLSDAEAWLDKIRHDESSFIFAAILPVEGLIGVVGLDAHPGPVWELGYWLGKPWWGHGYITEAAAAILDWAEQTHAIRAFVAGHYVDNPASGRVLTKLGFSPVGTRDMTGTARGFASPARRYTRGAPAELALGSDHHH